MAEWKKWPTTMSCTLGQPFLQDVELHNEHAIHTLHRKHRTAVRSAMVCDVKYSPEEYLLLMSILYTLSEQQRHLHLFWQ